MQSIRRIAIASFSVTSSAVRNARATLAASFILGAVSLGLSASADPSVIQPGMRAWVQAATTGRADAWFLGDSIAGSFDAGFSHALSQHFGLAGTGLGNYAFRGNFGTSASPNYTYYITPPPGNNWDGSASSVRADRQSYITAFDPPITAAAAPAKFYGIQVNPGGYLDPQAAYDWHVYTTSPDGGGSMQAQRMARTLPSDTVIQTTPAIPTLASASGLQDSVFHLDADPAHAGLGSVGILVNTTNTSVLYSRFVKPNTTGATLTTWAYGGHNAYDFYHDIYLAGPSSQAGRAQYLSALTGGGSGKLMVTIEEGTNDNSSTLTNVPSIHGILPGNSPAAFADNVTSLIDGIKSDWTVAGKAPDDLSFLVLGMYDYGHRTPEELAPHLAYSDQLAALARSRSDVSFVDLHDIAPTWEQAYAMGYMSDDVHPTVAGGIVYSDAIFNQLTSTPEPSTALLVLSTFPLLLARRRTEYKGAGGAILPWLSKQWF